MRDEAWISSLLSSSLFCTVGTVHDGWAYQRPSAFYYDPKKHAVYIHGAHSGRAFDNAEENNKVTVCVYDIGAMRLHSRAFEFLQEHAGVVVFGRAFVEDDNAEKYKVMQATFVKHAPHLKCGEDYEPASQEEIDETTVIQIEIENWSGKMKWTDDPARPRFTYDAVPVARPDLPWYGAEVGTVPVTAEWAQSQRVSDDTRTTNTLGQPIGPAIAFQSPRPAPDDASLTSRYCTLVRLDPTAHTSGLFAAFGNDKEGRNWTYLPYGPFESEKEFGSWLREVSTKREPSFYTILNTDGLPVGMASYLRIDPDMATIEVGHIHFSPLMQRTPVATKAMYLMMRNAFDILGYRRYEWKCDALNAASRGAARRFGFCFEGIFRQAAHYKGQNRDTAWLAIVDVDWPARRQAFEGWLSPENFRADGTQVRSLQEIALLG